MNNTGGLFGNLLGSATVNVPVEISLSKSTLISLFAITLMFCAVMLIKK